MLIFINFLGFFRILLKFLGFLRGPLFLEKKGLFWRVFFEGVFWGVILEEWEIYKI